MSCTVIVVKFWKVLVFKKLVVHLPIHRIFHSVRDTAEKRIV